MSLVAFLKSPWKWPIIAQKYNLGMLVPSEIYLKSVYRLNFGKKLNLNNPRTFNEKLQWLKLHDHREEYTILVDKHLAKSQVAKIIGEEYVIPTLGVWDRFDDIDFDVLPDQFVLKCTHDSGGLIICREKATLDKVVAKIKIEQCLARKYYYSGREWPYKNVKPRIIAEPFIADNLMDFKLFCFNGVPRITLVCTDRFTDNGLKEDFFDEEWNHLDVQRPNHGNAVCKIDPPKQYELMRKLAAKLSDSIPFVRVDFYEVNEKVLFGEMTFYPASGFEGFEPSSWDYEFGKWLVLPREN